MNHAVKALPLGMRRIMVNFMWKWSKGAPRDEKNPLYTGVCLQLRKHMVLQHCRTEQVRKSTGSLTRRDSRYGGCIPKSGSALLGRAVCVHVVHLKECNSTAGEAWVYCYVCNILYFVLQ